MEINNVSNKTAYIELISCQALNQMLQSKIIISLGKGRNVRY
jgi:hypothetical protein